MGIVLLQNVHLAYAGQVVLDELNWEIHRGEKVGLVGPNGSGKTTLFRLILRQLEPQIGTVTLGRGLQVAYLPQEPSLDSANSLLEEVTSTFENVRQLEERVRRAAELIAEHHDTDRLDDLMAEYDELCHRLEAAGGYHYETKVREVLGGLGFSTSDYDLPIPALSGGQRCRAALAKLLLQEADLLLLDEPTNHLDIEATQFLERFLAGYHGAAVVVSHDRYLLDRVVDKIADLDNRQVTVFPCGYSDYAESKRVRLMTAERQAASQEEWVHHQREYAERVKADKSRSRQARGRLRHLERMERQGEFVERPRQARRKMAIDFTPSRRGGDMVLRCDGVGKAYGEVVLFNDFHLEVYRGEKVGIIGPNGVGKTTLLKMAMRQIEPDCGVVRLFENLQVGYYDQEHADLELRGTVLEAMQLQRTAGEEAALRSFLARFLFFGKDVFKRVSDLSGGEQSRVILASLVYANPQVLVLDEPTNHLDIPGREALEEALMAYEGAILLVSHDRYFLDRVVNRLLVLPERGKYELIPGNWTTYEQRRSQQEAGARAAVEQAKAAARPSARPRRKRGNRAAVPGAPAGSPYASWSLAKLEEAIIEQEERLARTEEQFADPNVYRDADRARALRAEVEALRATLTDLNTEWEAKAVQ